MPHPHDFVFHPPVLTYSIQTSSPTCAVPGGSPCAPSLVYEPAIGRIVEAPLFVFLPGSSMEPNKHDLILQTAAYAGYRAIGLSYDNSNGVTASCTTSVCADNCAGKIRQEVLRGIDSSPEVVIAPQDAIFPRLWEVLDELHTADPTAGWDTYFDVNKVPARARIHHLYWDKIVLSGFSQGAGHALYLSQHAAVKGLPLAEGGNDTCVDVAGGPERAANWYIPGGGASAAAFHTSVSHDRGQSPFVMKDGMVEAGYILGANIDIPLVGFAAALSDWEMGLSAQLYSSVGVCSVHMSMARDGCMPIQNASTAATVAGDANLFELYLQTFYDAGQ